MTKKAGRPKVKAAERKQEARDALTQTNCLVAPVAEGVTPSFAVLREAMESGVSYKYASTFRALSVLQSKRAKITVCERRTKPPTSPLTVMTVLPIQRLSSIDAQIATFQNRWFSDHEERMPQSGITVMTGRVVYDVPTLKAMRSWHTAISHFNGIETAIKWVQDFDESQWQPNKPLWTEDLLDQDTVSGRLRDIDVLSEYYWVTSLCGKTMVEGPCLNIAVETIAKRHVGAVTLFSIPCDVLTFPHFNHEMIKAQTVWRELGDAKERMNLEKDKLLFFAELNYDLNHWCAVTVDFSSNDETVYDPQQSGNKFKYLLTFLSSELLPLLPQPASPKRFRFTQCPWGTQLDNYNCGISVLLFLELCIQGFN